MVSRTFNAGEWALDFTGDSKEVHLVRIAENVDITMSECLVYFGHFTTKYKVSSLHKIPSSMKKLIPKDRPGKLTTTMGI